MPAAMRKRVKGASPASAKGKSPKAAPKAKGKAAKRGGGSIASTSTANDDGEWQPEFGIDPLGAWGPYDPDGDGFITPYVARVELAKSSRAKCRFCCEKFSKGDVKVGLPMKWQGGRNSEVAPHGWATSWGHPACVRVPAAADACTRQEMKAYVHDFDVLGPKDQSSVLNNLMSKDVPEAQQELRPEDIKDTRTFEEAPEPTKLVQRLLPFQREGLGWMLKQEESKVRGGILADEMGMGKTIQTIAMLLASKERAAAASNASKTPSQKASTLIVLPTSALMQWSEEIKSFTEANALDVFIYYGDRSHVTEDELRAHDVVLTTYPIVEMEYRKVIDLQKKECPYCGKRFLLRTFYVHQKYFCGPEAVRTERLKKRETKQEQAKQKAMETLKIGVPAQPRSEGKIPTIMNVYKELMVDAGRTPLGMGEPGQRAAARRSKAAEDAKARVKVKIEDPIVISSGEEDEGEKPKKAKKDKVKDEGVVKGEDEDKASPKGAKRAAPKKRGRGSPAKVKDEDEWLPDASGDASDDDDESDDDDSDSDFQVRKKPKGRGRGRVGATARGKGVAGSKGKKVKVEAPSPSGGGEGTKAGGTGKGKMSATEEWQKQLFGENFEKILAEAKDPEDAVADSSLLHSFTWDRIILDEAHKIKGRTTSVAKAVYCLKSAKKWCLTGTPLQNRVGELYSLLRFLQVDPYAYYFCRKEGCNCKSLHWRFGPNNKACECCGHTSMSHYSQFNQTILNPITRYGYIGEGKNGVLTLKQVLQETQLRRTKKGRAEDVKLPKLEISIKELTLDEKEKDFYESLYKQVQVKFDAYVRRGTLLHNYAHIFELLSRLRQAVNHPFIVLHGNQPDKVTQAAASYTAKAGTSSLCGICHEEVAADEVVSGGCGHEFHRTCMLQYVQALPPGAKLKCPTCHQKMTIDLSETEERDMPVEETCVPCHEDAAAAPNVKKSSFLSKIDTSKFVTSSKIDSLVESILEMREAGDEHKGIVFSQYTRMLDLVEWRIKKLGIKTVKMVGSMPIMMRRSMLDAFKTDDDVKLLLLSLKAGGEGLNLQVASHVFVIDPWWNPAVEMQAIQRAHRIGQTKDVKAVRFCTKGTIEERMFQLQEKKSLVFEATIDGDFTSMAKLTEEDIRFLFT